MKKIILLLLALSLLLVLTACNNTISNNNCHICGGNHPRDVVGGASPMNFFEIFTPDSNEFLRIFVESCWGSSVPPDLRLQFTTRYDIVGLYEAISNAYSNVPFEVSFADETITLTTGILGLEEVFITYHQIQREGGSNFIMRRGGE